MRAGLLALLIGVLCGVSAGPVSGQIALRVGSDDPPSEATKKDNGDKNGGDNGNSKEKEEEKPTWWSAHGQATVVSQGNWKFDSPYQGVNSLTPNLNYRTTATATLYLDARVWEGGEIIFNPEMAGGEGLSHTLGLAGFPNGEATRVGVLTPTPYVARLLYKQSWELGSEKEKVEDGPNQIAGQRAVDRITFRIGKMAATDIFDDNSFSHDPRTQFLNWSLMYNGAWDYPANARGYTYGATLELNHKDWAVRYGVFAEPTIANGREFDPHFVEANGHIVELEERYTCNDHLGKLRLMAYLNNAHMGDYRESLAIMPIDPNIAATRVYRVKYGFGLDVEQEVTKELGMFVRLGWSDGHTETWAFTEIGATAALGLLLKGKRWCRPNDQVGLAFVINGLSNGHRDYLAAGGLGFIIGDGRLNYAPEEILESFYNWRIKEGINITFDLQGVNNPAYNRDRGPVALAGVRMHFEF